MTARATPLGVAKPKLCLRSSAAAAADPGCRQSMAENAADIGADISLGNARKTCFDVIREGGKHLPLSATQQYLESAAASVVVRHGEWNSRRSLQHR